MFFDFCFFFDFEPYGDKWLKWLVGLDGRLYIAYLVSFAVGRVEDT